MTARTIPELTEMVYRSMPYPNLIKALSFEESAIRFQWRSQHFRVSATLHVETVGDGVLIGDDAAILLAELLRARSTP